MLIVVWWALGTSAKMAQQEVRIVVMVRVICLAAIAKEGAVIELKERIIQISRQLKQIAEISNEICYFQNEIL